MEEINYDTLLDSVGGFGWYQRRLWFSYTILLEIFMSQNQMFMIFAGAQPVWDCHYNSTSSVTSNSTLLSSESSCDAVYKSCPKVVYHEPIQSVATEFSLYCGYSSVVEIMIAVQMCGVLFGAAFWGQMAAFFGRKRVLFAIALFELSISAAMAFSPCWHVFMIMIFFSGFGTGGYWNVVYVFVQEQLIAKWRIFASAINGWYIGTLIFPLIFWYLQDWRKVLLAVNLTGLLCLFSFLWSKESSRWLIQHGRLAEAYDVLSYIATVNGKPLPDRALIEQYHSQSTKNSKKRYNYKHLFATRSLTVKVVALASSWFVVSCVSYALSFNVKNLPGNRYINALLMAANSSVCGWMVLLWNKCCGRRHLHQMSLTTMAVCMLIVVCAISYGDALGSTGELLVTAFAIAGSGFSAPAWQVVYLYSVEMFPTVLRPLSNGMGSMAARVGGTIAPLILILGKTWTALPYMIFLALCMGNLLLSCIVLPETRGRPLPEGLPAKKTKAVRSSGKAVNKSESQKYLIAMNVREPQTMPLAVDLEAVSKE